MSDPRCKCGDLYEMHRIRPEDGKRTLCKACGCRGYVPVETVRLTGTLRGQDAAAWNKWAEQMRAIVFVETGKSVRMSDLMRIYFKASLPLVLRRMGQPDKSEIK